MLIDYLPHMTPTMIVPDCDHCVLAKLLQGFCVICMLRYQVYIGLHTHIEHPFHCISSTISSQFRETVCLEYLLDGLDTVDTAVEILSMTEIVEGNCWVVPDISVCKDQMSC
jgi:hypothetical protein